MSNQPCNFTVLRQRLAAQGVFFARQPSEFPASADVLGINADALGFDGFRFALNELHRAARERVGRDYTIRALRAAVTGKRLGYSIHALDQADTFAIRDRMERVIDQVRARAVR